MIDDSADEFLAKWSAWLKQGQTLRAQLVEERATLVAKLDVIEKALAAIPSEQEPKPGPPPVPLVYPHSKPLSLRAGRHVGALGRAPKSTRSAPEIVIAVVTEYPRSGAPRVIEEARKINPSLTPVIINSAIHRLMKRGILRAEGAKGKRIYSVNSSRYRQGDLG
jgi:hypothetical protein